MDAGHFREQFAAELRRHRVSTKYVQRLLSELDDHIADLSEERSPDMTTARKPEITSIESESTNVINLYERLGDPKQLAALAAKQYHNRSFLGRHPVLTFLVMPLPLSVILTLALFFAPILGTQGLAWFFPQMTDSTPVDAFNYYNQHPLLCETIMKGMAAVWTVFPPLLAALWLCRIARRNALATRWSIIACTLIAIWAGIFDVRLSGPTRPGNATTTLMAGFFSAEPTNWHFWFYFLSRFALAMGIGLLLIKRAQRLQKIDEGRQEEALLRRAA